jgi:hypothetical protein
MIAALVFTFSYYSDITHISTFLHRLFRLLVYSVNPGYKARVFLS